jgi:lysophospholipase L1-like esterase
LTIDSRFLPRCAAIVAFVALSACGSKSTPGGPTPTPKPPQISCPADVTVSSVPTPTQAVTFAAPTVTDGAAPVNVTCSPASGATFPLGTTAVGCQAIDALQRPAACSFNVTLKGFSIAVTRFVAYGDSLTEGETGRPSLVESILDPPNAYPTKLQSALEAAYPGQGVSVLNRGHSGDPVESLVDPSGPSTLNAMIRFLPTDKPDVVLLLSGYNNLRNACDPGASGSKACRDAITLVRDGLRDCIRRTRELSSGTKYIFLSTLTPPGPTGSQRIDSNAIVQTNGLIQQLAVAQSVTLVDAYAAFLGHEAEYVNVDGLHLRPAGYQALADAFFAAIQKTVTQTPLFGFRPPGS